MVLGIIPNTKFVYSLGISNTFEILFLFSYFPHISFFLFTFFIIFCCILNVIIIIHYTMLFFIIQVFFPVFPCFFLFFPAF